MVKMVSIALILASSFFTTLAQSDSIAYSKDYEFKEGIYSTIKKFKENTPVIKNVIITPIPKDQPDFYNELVENRVIIYKNFEGVEQQLESSTIWGYCQNRSIYINFNSAFQRLNVIGFVCHFTAIVKSVTGYNNPTNYGINNTHNELRQYVLNTQTNEVLDFTVQNMEAILSNDVELYKEFMELKKRDKPKHIFIYLRKYNDRHPLYLKKNNKK